MHIPSHILREQLHLEPRMCQRLLAAYAAFSDEVAVGRHASFLVGSVVEAPVFCLHASG